MRSDDAEEPEAGLEADVFGLNAVIVCETPSARINCSRSSMFVRPLAVFVILRNERGDIEEYQGYIGGRG